MKGIYPKGSTKDEKRLMGFLVMAAAALSVVALLLTISKIAFNNYAYSDVRTWVAIVGCLFAIIVSMGAVVARILWRNRSQA